MQFSGIFFFFYFIEKLSEYKMLNIKIITVGSVKEEFYRNKINEYMTSISKHSNASIIELKDESIPSNAGEAAVEDIKKREGERILSSIDSTDYVVALCIDGRLTNTNGVASLMSKASADYTGCVCFIIGGSLGLNDAVIRRANYKLSFSRMTFPHQLMRVMLLEQIDAAL